MEIYVFVFVCVQVYITKKYKKYRKKCRKMKKDDFSCLGEAEIEPLNVDKKIAHFEGSERFLYMARCAVVATKSR